MLTVGAFFSLVCKAQTGHLIEINFPYRKITIPSSVGLKQGDFIKLKS